jgi:hypothetical protein
VSDLKGPHFNAGIISLARYAQYLFNLQHNTTKMTMQLRTCLMTYEESAIATAHELERLSHENAIFRSSAYPLLEQDHELQDVYYHLSYVEHGWSYTHMLLNITHEGISVSMRSSTLSSTWRRRTPSLRRG